LKTSISKGSTRCRSCAAKAANIPHRKVVDRPSLEQLESDLKKFTTMVRVGKHYGVSDNCIRKLTKQKKIRG